MKKLILSLFVLMFVAVTAMAQDRTITGTVTNEENLPIPGVSVKPAGAQGGTVTGSDGKFTIKVASSVSSLTFTFVGMIEQTKSIGSNGVVNATLVSDSKVIESVVVTALGISRKEASVGYATQTLKGDDLTQTKQTDLGTALAGKIAGVQILGGSGAKFGTADIRIRGGINGIGGGLSPIFVVDGVVVPSTSVNLDDVENLTVLKGPAATSLYGQRGDNGVVVITSKRAQNGRQGLGVDVNHSTTIETVGLLPDYQNEYGGGPSQSWLTFTYNPATDNAALAAISGKRYHDFQTDESWGPKIDGQPYLPWYAFNKWDPQYAQTQTYQAFPDNVTDFYETGVENNSNVAFSKAGDLFNLRFSYTNVNRTGISPNTWADQNRLGFIGTVKPVKNLSFTTNVNYNTINYFNRPVEGYGTQTTGSFSQWFQRDTDIEKLKAYKNPDGTYTTWNITGPRNLAARFWDNPYTEANVNIRRNNSSRIFGSLQASYNITSDLTLDAIARGNYSNGWADGRTGSGTIGVESYSTSQSRDRENNYVLDLMYRKSFSSFSLSAGAFGELRINHGESISGNTVGGFTVPNFYSLGASKDRPGQSSSLSDKKVRSIYGYANLGYKDFIYLDLNLRNDWSSTLPVANNSYLYGGANLSFVFTELMKKNSILSFGKAYASYGRVGSDVDAYSIYQTYSAGGFYGTFPSLSVPDRIPNLDLRPTLSDAIEAGLDLRFLNNNLKFSVNYYDRTTKDQIISLTLPATTGFSSALINAGEISNKGWEFSLGGTPIKNKSVVWDVNANVGFNKNSIVELDPNNPNLTNFPLASFGYVGTPSITVNRQVGQPWGTLITQAIKKDANGNKVIDDDGFPVLEDNVNLGTYTPKFTGGFTTSVAYKGFILGTSLDFQVGGKLFSVSRGNTFGSGLAEETAGLNDKGKPKRDPVASGGGILIEGVRESDGKPNATYIDPQDYYEGYIPYTWAEQTYKATYWKVREISLGYTLPSSVASKIRASRATVTLIARNPWLIYSAIPGIDPSESGGSYQEGAQLPSTRSFGLNLKLTF